LSCHLTPMSFTQKLVQTISEVSFADCSATVVGCGYMGKEYLKALQTLNLKVSSIRVCSRRIVDTETIPGRPIVSSSGYQNFRQKPAPQELAIIAIPTKDLLPAARHLRELGFKRFLIEKPLALSSQEIQEFQKEFTGGDTEVMCAYNRVAYPSFLEAKNLAEQEGGITSCYYTMTEIIGKDWTERFPREELAHWGIANSLHVASMAHGLIGLPKSWTNFQEGNAYTWHPTGSIFVGSGISQQNIPFAYHADWTSTGRWSVEFHTRRASYLLCPLEKLFRRTSFKEAWIEVPLHTYSDKIKVGIVEEVAAMLSPQIKSLVSLYSLEDTYLLTQFGEEVFGYAS